MKICAIFLIFLFHSCSSKNKELREVKPTENIFSKSASFDSSGDFKLFEGQFEKVEAGSFMMGSSYVAAQKDEKPVHKVVKKLLRL